MKTEIFVFGCVLQLGIMMAIYIFGAGWEAIIATILNYWLARICDKTV